MSGPAALASGPARASPRTVAHPAWLAAAAGLVALQAALALTHVPWDDEIQAWQIAAWSPSWPGLLANLSYEGHPALWYGLLRIASFASPSVGALAVLQAAIATLTATLILARAPFPQLHRLAIAASYLVLFEYGTIARSYGLGTLLLVAFLACRNRPAGWLCLALMTNVSLHVALLSGACLVATALVDRRIPWAGGALWLGAAAIGAAVMVPAPDAATILTLPQSGLVRLDLFLSGVAGLLIPTDPFRFPMLWNHELLVGRAGLGILALAWLGLALAPDRRFLALGAGLLGAVAAVCLLVYPTSLRHAGVLFLFVVAADWMRTEAAGDAPNGASRALAGVTAAIGLLMAAGALTTPFTTLRVMAGWAEAEGMREVAWTAYPIHKLAAISGGLGRPVHDFNHRCLTRFGRWDAATATSDDLGEFLARSREAAAASGGILLIAVEGAHLSPGRGGVELMRTFPAGLMGADVSVYALRATPAGQGPPRLCAWTRG